MLWLLPIIGVMSYGAVRFALSFLPLPEIEMIAVSVVASIGVVAGLVGWTFSATRD